jgi:nucleoside phosphorylase
MPNILLVSATKDEHGEEELFGHPIHIVGVGKVNATLNTAELIKEYDPDYVVNFGSCGNLKDYKPGELLRVGIVYNDFYAGKLFNYIPHKMSDTGIKCLTTDIIDMELYGIACACLDSGKFLRSYKWVSDDGEPEKWEENAQLGFKKFKEVFKEYLDDIEKYHKKIGKE